MEPTPEQIGDRIATAILEVTQTRPVNLTWIAAELGVSLSTLHRWMKGENEPSYAKMVRLSRITGKPLDWFMEPSQEAVA